MIILRHPVQQPGDRDHNHNVDIQAMPATEIL